MIVSISFCPDSSKEHQRFLVSDIKVVQLVAVSPHRGGKVILDVENRCSLASASNWRYLVAASLGRRVKIKERKDQSNAELETSDWTHSRFCILVLLG